ncbi:MAG: carbon storage regulator CsrA [Planctomycetes bacterium]|nr:carbon storage regulator CsrA [Planctomycetota bacterium]
MLVLSRQRDETIMIGDDVEITVVDIRGDKVRLGISAPRHIQVHRKEVYEAIKRENQQASNLSPQDMSDVAEHDNNRDRHPGEVLNPKKIERTGNNSDRHDSTRQPS